MTASPNQTDVPLGSIPAGSSPFGLPAGKLPPPSSPGPINVVPGMPTGKGSK